METMINMSKKKGTWLLQLVEIITPLWKHWIHGMRATMRQHPPLHHEG